MESSVEQTITGTSNSPTGSQQCKHQCLLDATLGGCRQPLITRLSSSQSGARELALTHESDGTSLRKNKLKTIFFSCAQIFFSQGHNTCCSRPLWVLDLHASCTKKHVLSVGGRRAEAQTTRGRADTCKELQDSRS